jgi:hypothetical protein
VPKYRKKPVTISAEQYLPAKTPFPAGVVPIPPDVFEKLEKEAKFSLDGAMWVETLEGGHIASPGDYIITGVKGERYPCKPDIFESTYERVADPDPSECGNTGHPVFAYPCILAKGHLGPHDNGSGSPWEG